MELTLGKRLIGLAALLSVAIIVYLIINARATGTDEPAPTILERWEEVTPGTVYHLSIEQTNPLRPIPDVQDQPSLVPPRHHLRHITITVNDECEVRATTLLEDAETGERVYQIKTTRDESEVEFFDRSGMVIAEEDRHRLLDSNPAEFDKVRCGTAFTEPADYWAGYVQDLGAVLVGQETFAGDPVTRFVLEESVTPDQAERLWSESDEFAAFLADIAGVRTTWLIHDLTGMVVSSSSELILNDGGVILVEKFSILRSEVEETE